MPDELTVGVPTVGWQLFSQFTSGKDIQLAMRKLVRIDAMQIEKYTNISLDVQWVTHNTAVSVCDCSPHGSIHNRLVARWSCLPPMRGIRLSARECAMLLRLGLPVLMTIGCIWTCLKIGGAQEATFSNWNLFKIWPWKGAPYSAISILVKMVIQKYRQNYIYKEICSLEQYIHTKPTPNNDRVRPPKDPPLRFRCWMWSWGWASGTPQLSMRLNFVNRVLTLVGWQPMGESPLLNEVKQFRNNMDLNCTYNCFDAIAT